MMIDWVTAKLPCLHTPINGGMVVKLTPENDPVWIKSCLIPSVGSYDSNIYFKSDGGDGQGRATELIISGNPSKYLQGHNLFGSDNLIALMLDVYNNIVNQQNLNPLLTDLKKVREGKYTLSRIDINESFKLGNRLEVDTWIRAAEYSSRTRHGSPSLHKSSTLYYGKTSSRWSIKIYSKGQEIECHVLPEELQGFIGHWADPILRVELVLRGKELLDLDLKTANKLTPSKLKELYDEYIGRIEMSRQMHLSDSVIFDLPRPLRNTYVMWRDGYNVKDMLSKPTFYKHRRALITGWSIDISNDVNNSGVSNVIPLLRVLEATPAHIPSVFYREGVIHHSAKQVMFK